MAHRYDFRDFFDVRDVSPVTSESVNEHGAPLRPTRAQRAPSASYYRPAIVRRDERGAES